MSQKGVAAGPSSNRREFRKFRRQPPKPKSSTTICKFFKSEEGCKFGEKCRFQHENAGNALVEQMETLEICENPVQDFQPNVYLPPESVRQAVKPVIPVLMKIGKEEKGSENQRSMLDAEISFFKKRYRNCKILSNDVKSVIVFKYGVTDPEWIFELKTITIQLEILPGHPIDVPGVKIMEELNQCLPEVVRSYLETKINEAIQSKYTLFEKRNAFETIGKALIKWLDHSIFQIFVEGLRRTKLAMQGERIGLSLVMPALKEKSRNEPEKKGSSGIEEPPLEPLNDEKSNSSEEIIENIEEKSTSQLPIDVVLVWKDSSGNVATLQATQLKISTKCMRCGTEKDTDAPVNDTVVGWRCAKCSQAESSRLRSQLVHANSNVLCNLDLKGCKPLDIILLDSKFRIVCLNCNNEDDLQKLNYGDAHKSWCRNCHTLLELSISHIRFRGDFEQCGKEDKEVAGSIPKPKKMIEKRGAIEEGSQLPEMGSCEHYKKSYRWFRFPCCGKLYPCDTCHEEKTDGEHEMKVANRIVCGHCSKEQPFQNDKPCIGCGECTTRRRTQYWEGGKGCRDQGRMNKNDSHKFVNSRKKTVAKTKVATLATKKN